MIENDEKEVLIEDDDAAVLDENYDDNEPALEEDKKENTLVKTPEEVNGESLEDLVESIIASANVVEESLKEAEEESKQTLEEPQEELTDNASKAMEETSEPQEEDDQRAIGVLEGLLFLTGDDGITLEQAADALHCTPERAAELFDKLTIYYTDDKRGIEIARFGKTYRFLSKAYVHPYAEKLFQITKTDRLSPAALETLAIIAYKQPITRVEIEEIRGVGADVMLRKLQARNLIKEDGRSEAAGRPILYSVTDEFMDSFQLLSLDELPELPTFGEEKTDEEKNDDLFVQ